MIIALRIPSPKNGVRRRVETRKLGVLGSETAQNTQFSGIFVLVGCILNINIVT
jgi:hypothetical protein